MHVYMYAYMCDQLRIRAYEHVPSVCVYTHVYIYVCVCKEFTSVCKYVCAQLKKVDLHICIRIWM